MEENKRNDTNGNAPRFNTFWIWGIIALAIIGMQFFSLMGANQQPLTFTRLGNMLKGRDIYKIEVVNKEKAFIYLKKDAIHKYEDAAKRASEMANASIFTSK